MRRPSVDVIIDRHDDLATVNAIQALAAREPAVLVIQIAPGSRTAREVVWAILRALGKRIERLDRRRKLVWWPDAERWLRAHRIAEVVVLCAQHLGRQVTNELIGQLRHRYKLGVTFIYGGARRRDPEATTTLEEYLARERPPAAESTPPPPWPSVPRSHPLRLRYDCLRELEADEFGRVEQLLDTALCVFGRWRSPWAEGHPRLIHIRRALSVACAADDPEQAYVRKCATKIGLIQDQIAIPDAPPAPPRAHALTGQQLAAIHACNDPTRACYELAKLITGLPDCLATRIAADQISDRAIVGCPVPESARAVLRALEIGDRPIFERISHESAPEPLSWETTPEQDKFATTLGTLMQGRSQRIPRSNVTRTVRARLDSLGDDGILDVRHGAYRASHIALYGCFLAPPPPTRLR